MKKSLLIAIVFISPYISVGQIVLDQTDLPMIGDIQVFNKLDSTLSAPVTPGSSGANQTWNYATLTGLLDTNYYVNPASTPNGSVFVGSDIAIRDTEQSGDRYEYLTTGPTGMKLFGFDDISEIIVLDIQGYEFPILTYGSSANHTLRARFDVIDANNYDAVYVVLVSTADAWGTMTTPAGTVNVLRIYTTETVYDSSYVGGVGFQNSVTSGNYYYKWYAKNLGWPVLEISKGVLADPDYKTVKYANDLSSVSTGIAGIFLKNNFSLYPNPFSMQTVLKTDVFLQNGTLTVVNCFGQTVKEIKNINGQTVVLSRDNLPSGLYFIRLTEENKIIVADKLVITDK